MKILVLGGTHFLGRHLVEAALLHHHDLTLFNRGKTDPGAFPNVKQIHGDRAEDIVLLLGHQWDAVIDTSGYLPRVVRQSVEQLAPYVSRYLFVSSISVYRDFHQVQMTEDSPVDRLKNPDDEDIFQSYGPLKALCEEEVRQGFGQRALIVRPGLIVGPHDPTDRFTYWVRRFASGQAVVVPRPDDRPVQFIDARDLAAWMLQLLERSASGTFQATGPIEPLTMGALIAAFREALPDAGKPVWIPEPFLREHHIAEWTDLPLWISERMGWPGFLAVNIDRARDAGLSLRPVTETIHDTWQWDQSRGAPHLTAGLDDERHNALLAAWRQKGG